MIGSKIRKDAILALGGIVTLFHFLLIIFQYYSRNKRHHKLYKPSFSLFILMNKVFAFVGDKSNINGFFKYKFLYLAVKDLKINFHGGF